MKLHKAILLKALDSYKKEMEQIEPGSSGFGEALWEIKRVEEAVDEINNFGKIHGYELLTKHGGNWLGTVHNWIQCKFRNGESVIWGSEDVLEGKVLTVRDMEELAGNIAAAAYRDVF